MREFINNVEEEEKCMHVERFDAKFSTEIKFNVGDRVCKNNLALLKSGENKSCKVNGLDHV